MCLDALLHVSDVKFKEMNQASSVRSARDDSAERVIFAKLTELDASPITVVEGVDERVRVLTHGWGTAKNFVKKRRPSQVEVDFADHRSTLEGPITILNRGTI